MLINSILLLAAALAGQPASSSYTISKYTLDSGGITVAASASYSASMTVGQPAASGLLNATSYQATSGFWTPAVPVERPDFLFADSFESAPLKQGKSSWTSQ